MDQSVPHFLTQLGASGAILAVGRQPLAVGRWAPTAVCRLPSPAHGENRQMDHGLLMNVLAEQP